MPHAPSWHILDNNFPGENDGLSLPSRRLCDADDTALDVCRAVPEAGGYNTLQCDAFGLRIVNLDRGDPPHYTPNSVPRHETFNANSGAAFRITAEPRMPMIEVRCETLGFDPADSPIYWRLQCRHVLCRHQNQGGYRYRGVCEFLEDEWQGRSRASTFELFRPASSPDLDYDYNGNEPGGPVMGGHALLSVAARPPGSAAILMDYVHLRIGGTNPQRADVLRYLDERFAGRNVNIKYMVQAVFAHENRFRQFDAGVQRRTTMRFRQKHHQNNASQPDCAVAFDWPDDPANFPSVSFDWGVGISQYTKIRGRTIGREAVWDWRANIRSGINELLDALRRTYQAGSTWRRWAKRAWKAYNGSGPQADAYANTVEALPEGQQVSAVDLADGIDLAAETAAIPSPPDRTPPIWPPLDLGLAVHPGGFPEPEMESARPA